MFFEFVYCLNRVGCSVCYCCLFVGWLRCCCVWVFDCSLFFNCCGLDVLLCCFICLCLVAIYVDLIVAAVC